MKTTNKLNNKYISEVKKNLKCSSKKRKDFLNTLTPEIYNFELEHPNATYDDYITEFNTPKTTAKEYMKELSDKERFAYFAPRIGAIIAVIISILALLILLFIIQANGYSGYASSANDDTVNSSTYIEYLDDGSYLVTNIEQYNSDTSLLLSEKVGSKTKTYYSSSDVTLCTLKITATFSYNGSSVSCVGTKSTKYSYDSSWSVEDVTTLHGSTSTAKDSATANGNFIKRFLGIKTNTIPASVTINCDVNGNLS